MTRKNDNTRELTVTDLAGVRGGSLVNGPILNADEVKTAKAKVKASAGESEGDEMPADGVILPGGGGPIGPIGGGLLP